MPRCAPLGIHRGAARSALAVLALSYFLALPAWATETGPVVRVVDGDTIIVEIAGQQERVRLIGVDTPETVHPQKPVEHFGKEASTFTKRMCEGKTVRLEPDPSVPTSVRQFPL